MNDEYNGKERRGEVESLEVETGNVSVMKVEKRKVSVMKVESHAMREEKKP